jgi:hypothetical protein
MAAVKGRVEAHLGCQGANEDAEVGVRDPLVGRKGKQRVGLGGFDDGEEAAKGSNGAKHGARDGGDGDFDGRAIELASFGEAERKDGTPLNKMDVATREVGTGFPSSFKLRNQVAGSKEGEETHAESGPLGKVTRGMEVDEGPERDQVVEGEVSLRLRGPQVSANSREASSQGRELCLAHREFDSNHDVHGGKSRKVRADGGVGVLGHPEPSSVANKELLARRGGMPFVGQEKPKEGVPGAAVGGEGGVGQRGLYTRGGDQSQLDLSCSKVWM